MVHSTRRDFLGRATVPTALLLHPPQGRAHITLQLLPLDRSTYREREDVRSDVEHEYSCNDGCSKDSNYPGANIPSSSLPRCGLGTNVSVLGEHTKSPPAGEETQVGYQYQGGVKEKVCRNIAKSVAVTGTLTVSLELCEDWDANGDLPCTTSLGGMRRPRSESSCGEMEFKVAEDVVPGRMRGDTDGRHEPEMRSGVK